MNETYRKYFSGEYMARVGHGGTVRAEYVQQTRQFPFEFTPEMEQQYVKLEGLAVDIERRMEMVNDLTRKICEHETAIRAINASISILAIQYASSFIFASDHEVEVNLEAANAENPSYVLCVKRFRDFLFDPETTGDSDTVVSSMERTSDLKHVRFNMKNVSTERGFMVKIPCPPPPGMSMHELYGTITYGMPESTFIGQDLGSPCPMLEIAELDMGFPSSPINVMSTLNLDEARKRIAELTAMCAQPVKK